MRRPPLPVVQDAHVRLGLQHLECVVVVAGRKQHLDELADQRFGQLAVNPAVQADHPTEGRHRVARKRPLVRLERSSPTATPQGLLCLMITHAGIWNSRQQLPRRVEVEQVVERELLAAQLGDHRQHVRACADLGVVGGALMWVLAVGQLEHLLERAHHQRREVLAFSWNQRAIAVS